jgi:thioredoxin-related protein
MLFDLNQKNFKTMQKVILLFLAVFVLTPLTALGQDVSRVKWYSIEEAEKLNKQAPKKIMIDVYTDWCGWCKKMDKETFNHPVIADYINEHYYPVKLNAESKEEITFNGTTYKYVAQGARGYHELAAGLLSGKMSYPSIAYMNEKLELLGAVPGFYTPDRIEPLLNYIAEEKYTSQSLEEFQKSFQSKLSAD